MTEKMQAKTQKEHTVTLENREKIYRVIRNPEYERPAKKGGGTTKEKPSATLYLPDGSIVSVQKRVDEKIVEIIFERLYD